uniref:Uncharacterized protein n=1 Tax=Strongyloides papillosus TaxID=174720 RepID=A0A0N5CGA4_STREA
MNDNYDAEFQGTPRCRFEDKEKKEEVTVQIYVEHSSTTFPKKTGKCNQILRVSNRFAHATLVTNAIYLIYSYGSSNIKFRRDIPKDCYNVRHFNATSARFFCYLTDLDPLLNGRRILVRKNSRRK